MPFRNFAAHVNHVPFVYVFKFDGVGGIERENVSAKHQVRFNSG